MYLLSLGHKTQVVLGSRNNTFSPLLHYTCYVPRMYLVHQLTTKHKFVKMLCTILGAVLKIS